MQQAALFRRETAKPHEQHVSAVWYLSLSAGSTASALADPFDLIVFCLRESAKSAGESAVKI